MFDQYGFERRQRLLKIVFCLLVPIVIATAGWVGIRYEATRIQQTCEADSGATWLNGTPYLCLSQRQIDIMRSHNERGA